MFVDAGSWDSKAQLDQVLFLIGLLAQFEGGRSAGAVVQHSPNQRQQKGFRLVLIRSNRRANMCEDIGLDGSGGKGALQYTSSSLRA